MKQRPPQNWWRRYWMGLGSLTVALAAALAAQAYLSKTMKVSLRAPALTPVESTPQRSVRPDRDVLAESLLTDSILSIIQSYYVDSDRVDNRHLLETAVNAIALSPRLEVRNDPGFLHISIDGQTETFAISQSLEYGELLDVFGEIGRMLDENQVQIALGESNEVNAPGSVVLLNSLLATLDAHSTLLSPEAYRELRQGTEGSFGGLGVLVGIRDDLLTVIKPLPRSPALRAGVQERDRILQINGVRTYGYSLDDLVEHMRGEPGTVVNLSLLREGAIAPSELRLKREVIHVDSVTSETVNVGGVDALHLTIESFSSRTSREVLGAIKKFREANQGNLPGLILDLRSNPGGLLDQAVQVADLFLEDGTIVTTKGRRVEEEQAGSGFDEMGFPIVVLINGDSASASEIVAGALQDHSRGIVVGQPSFGKGSVQTIFELPGERALKLTIARYYTPLGRSIQNVGIIPDVWMHPVEKAETNSNLLGHYRYKNERFLKNHLDITANDVQRKTWERTQKGFYLFEGEETEDHEMDLAKLIINKVHKTYGPRLPNSANRSTHWLGLAGPEMKRSLVQLQAETEQWLAKKFKVNWQREAGKAPNVRALNLSINDHQAIVARPGEDVTLKWQLRNHSNQNVDRVSVFLRSDAPGFETFEQLVGRVPANGRRTGEFKVQIPTWWETGPLNLRVSVAVDAWPADVTQNASVVVVTRDEAQISAAAVLENENGGKLPGVLEHTEQAVLKVSLTNTGDAAAEDLKIGLVNLAGRQLELIDDYVELDRLEAGQTMSIRLGLRAGAKVLTNEMGVGLYVDAIQLRETFRQRIGVVSAPNTNPRRVSNLMGH